VSTRGLIDHIREANPLESDPPAAPIEELLARLDRTAPRFDDDVLQPKRKNVWRGTRLQIAAACAVAAAIALGAFLALGSSGAGTPNVLADVYRALTPGSGVLHMVEMTEQTAGGTTATTHEEIWTAQNPRRLHSVTTPPDGKTYEQAFTASPLESRRWSQEEPGVILHGTPVGALTHEDTPVSILRELFKKGELTLVGKTTLEGRAVWQLTVHPVNYTQPMFEGKQLPDPTMYVDAGSFAPVELVSQSLTHAGGQLSGALELETATTRYTTYEEAPEDAQSESSLKLAEHPGAVEKSEP
jgi:hypothetical protein